MYSEFVTGVYSSEDLERYISNIGRKVRLSDRIKAPDNKILIVMSKASYIGGHTVLVHNWIKWDDTKQYSIAFTDSDDHRILSGTLSIVQEEILHISGEIICKRRKS